INVSKYFSNSHPEILSKSPRRRLNHKDTKRERFKFFLLFVFYPLAGSFYLYYDNRYIVLSPFGVGGYDQLLGYMPGIRVMSHDFHYLIIIEHVSQTIAAKEYIVAPAQHASDYIHI